MTSIPLRSQRIADCPNAVACLCSRERAAEIFFDKRQERIVRLTAGRRTGSMRYTLETKQTKAGTLGSKDCSETQQPDDIHNIETNYADQHACRYDCNLSQIVRTV